jgi:hypothetical protein
MTFALLADLNWLAVVVAALVYFVLGGLWYMPRVFGDVWTRAIGWEPTDEDQPGPAMYLAPLATCVVATVAVALVAAAVGAASVADGIVLGLVVGVGVAGAVLFTAGYFDPHKRSPVMWFAVTGGYNAVGLLIAAIIVSVWR